MSDIYRFINNEGDTKVITGQIDWDSMIEWRVYNKRDSDKYKDNVGLMPLGVWCIVKSYELKMWGMWMLCEVK
tara:strand:- start:36 stop:254 length:219 start_codon:yes stop_codon:yes gene_type:complete